MDDAVEQAAGSYNFDSLSRLMESMPRFLIALFGLLLVLRPWSVYAQTASLTGTVTDPAGVVLPGVTITITEAQTNASRMFATDERGNYSVSFLPPRLYRIEAGLPGFKTAIRESVVLSVDDRLRIDFTLQIGEVAEKIVVTTTTPLVQSETSSVGTVIDNQKIIELPLNGREFEALAQLAPASLSPAPGSALSLRGGFNVIGARETANNNLLDGIDNNDPAINNFTLRPILDAIQEFKVLVNSYSAAYGRGAGAQVIVNTKSGTNGLHASAWEFLRNDRLDARDFFNKKDSAVNPLPEDVNQYSARLDHRFSGTNSLFGRYAHTQDSLLVPCASNNQTSCVPSFGHNDVTRAHSLSLNDTHIFSPKLVMEARAGFNRQLQSRIALASGKSDISSQLGIPASHDPKDFGHPMIAITGFGTIGDRGYQKRAGTTGQIAASLNYTPTSHSIRA